MTYTDQACPCGSGLITRWQYDKDHVPLVSHLPQLSPVQDGKISR
jgi:hypothetical protein